jgi:hypothetical protein
MSIKVTHQTTLALEILKEEEISAPIDIVFETILEQMEPSNEAPGAVRMPMILEPWPGGRWYRDTGSNSGHPWGHVQAIKRPSLLEVCGPLFMSYPAISNVQYRLTEHGGITRLSFVHRAMAQTAHDSEIEKNWARIEGGWENLLGRIRSALLAPQ